MSKNNYPINIRILSMFCVGAMVFTFACFPDIVFFFGVNISVFFAYLASYFMLCDIFLCGTFRKINVSEISLFSLGLWAIISFSWSDQSREALAFSYYYVLCFLVFVLVRRQCDSLERWYFVGICYLLGCLVACCIIIQNWQNGKELDLYRFSKEGVNANYIAYCLATAVPILMAIFLKWKRNNFFYLLITALILFIYFTGIALTGCRSALLAYLIGFLIFMFSLLHTFLHSKLKFLLILVSIISSGIIFYNYLPFEMQVRLYPLTDPSYDPARYNDLSRRLIIWPIALEIFKENYLCGVGAGVFQSLNSLGISAHNVFLSVATELGIVGLFLYLSSVTLPFMNISRIRASFSGATWSVVSLFLVWLTISLAGVWEVSMVAWFAFAWFANISILEAHN